MAVPICFWLLIHEALRPRSRADCNAGSSIAARMAIIAMTTSNSIKVKRACAGDKENFFSREKKFPLSPAPPFSFKKKRGGFAPVCRKIRQNLLRKKQRNTYLTSFIHEKFDQGEAYTLHPPAGGKLFRHSFTSHF